MKRRVHIAIRGAVQGVGFRPFVYRLAESMHLAGWVLNDPAGVFIEAEGDAEAVESFLLRIAKEKPPLSSILSFEPTFLDFIGYDSFEIRESLQSGDKSAVILPDAATCPDCLNEILNPENRRFRYPFTNCTNCGPRYTIIQSLPYDRRNTTMNSFEMCPECAREYEDPHDRRFHAQPNACPRCGPQLALWDPSGTVLSVGDAALTAAATAIRSGKIVAVKGVGGFHLMADAANEPAVQSLRQRKHREEKPFALMVPSLAEANAECELSALEARLLLSSASPIVLLHRRKIGKHGNSMIAPSVAPKNPCLGLMLPYSPLHHLLLREFGRPVVATSGNLSEEPICIDEYDALRRLQNIADLYLIHNRPIVRHVDDSVVRVVLGRELVLRRARGYAPLPVTMDDHGEDSYLAVGGHLKNTIALSKGKNIFVSQHIGDLASKESNDAFLAAADDLKRLYEIDPSFVISDAHPDYRSTQYADAFGGKRISIQHHYAHVASCMAENRLDGSVLGVSWDGTGFGADGTIWGGEFILTNESSYSRAGHFRQFRLPGGETAVSEPRRSALGAMFEIFGRALFQHNDIEPLKTFTAPEAQNISHMLARAINSPLTSSAGRIFDAVASLIGLRQFAAFEGQAAMELEWLIGETQTDAAYEFAISETESPMVVDWGPMLLEIVADVGARRPRPSISAKFHNTLAEIIVGVAVRMGEKRVVLTGGCFQNVYLLERTVRRLEESGCVPYWHQRIPPNDGGISLGQVYAAQRLMRKRSYQQEEPVSSEFIIQ